jgi:2,3-bisphosphoglycerate-independent phosphoglycerate mutase
MVGHTGILAAAVKAAETVDHCLGRVEAAVKAAGAALVITADHGNLEEMRDPVSGEPHTAHSLNPVPIIVVNGPAADATLQQGRLADVAPTVLALLGLAQPAAMTGHALMQERVRDTRAEGTRASA